MAIYSKGQGHHCWWLKKDGVSLAHFDKESDVDEIIEMSKRPKFDLSTVQGREQAVIANLNSQLDREAKANATMEYGNFDE